MVLSLVLDIVSLKYPRNLAYCDKISNLAQETLYLQIITHVSRIISPNTSYTVIPMNFSIDTNVCYVSLSSKCYKMTLCFVAFDLYNSNNAQSVHFVTCKTLLLSLSMRVFITRKPSAK